MLTPYTYIGHRLAQSLLRPHVLSFLDLASAFSQTELESRDGTIARDTRKHSLVEDAGGSAARADYGVIVLAVSRQSGAMQFNPQAQVRLESGDVLIAMGERQKLKQLENVLGA